MLRLDRKISGCCRACVGGKCVLLLIPREALCVFKMALIRKVRMLVWKKLAKDKQAILFRLYVRFLLSDLSLEPTCDEWIGYSMWRVDVWFVVRKI